MWLLLVLALVLVLTPAPRLSLATEGHASTPLNPPASKHALEYLDIQGTLSCVEERHFLILAPNDGRRG